MLNAIPLALTTTTPTETHQAGAIEYLIIAYLAVAAAVAVVAVLWIIFATHSPSSGSEFELIVAGVIGVLWPIWLAIYLVERKRKAERLQSQVRNGIKAR